MKNKFALSMAFAAFPLFSLTAANAQTTKPFLSPLFTDNMILQRGVADPVWGWTTPGAKVTVNIAGKNATAMANADGKWMARLPAFPQKGPFGPFTLAITGPQNVTLNNVMFGDVWICSGQSNMQFGVANGNNAAAEIATANYPNIRLITVPDVPAFAPVDTFNGKWDVCTPDTIAHSVGWGGFSAVGYFFGRTLNKELNVPIGLIHSSWGGTIAEAWVSGDSLKAKMPDFAPAVAQVEANANVKTEDNYGKRVSDWFTKNDAGTAGTYQAETFDASAWKTMSLPTLWEPAGLPDYDGVVWFRKEVTLPDGAAGKDATLHLGPIDDNDVTYVNGVQVGATDGYLADRSYKLPANTLKSGRNVIAVRVMDTGGGGGIYGKPEQMTLEITGETALLLSGDWQYKDTANLKSAPAYPMPIAGNNPNVPTVLYNGMIAPLVPFAIKGAIWYQGESNAGRNEQYRRLLPTLINDWRGKFGVGPFPFYIVQLANYMPQDTEPRDDAWPGLREAQYLTAKNTPNTGLAVAIDIGDAKDIHPKDKQDVGNRLALAALAQTYGKKIEYSGPIYKSMKVEGDKIRLTFTHIGGGLIIGNPPGTLLDDGSLVTPLRGFAIAGADGKFVWADAKIEGDTVVVSSAQVSKPANVHYAWGNNPVCNLYNKANLPAVPFRTDNPEAVKTAKSAAK